MSQIRKSVRALIASNDYKVKGIFEDFQPIDQIRRNHLTDPFFFQTVPFKALLHEIEDEAFTKKVVRQELLGKLFSLQKPPGTQFSDVFYRSRIDDDGKPPDKSEIEESPFNVLYRYDKTINAAYKALLKTLNEVGSGKSQNESNSRGANNGTVQSTSVISISPEGVSNIIEDVSTLILAINASTFENSVRDYGYIKAMEILEPKSVATAAFISRFRNSLDINSVYSIDTEEEENVDFESA
jgi:hypothetical protein